METRMLNVKINGRDYQVPEGTTILKAARDYAKIDVPTLCYLEGISEEGACAICVVEVKGARNLQRACVVKVGEGMEVFGPTLRVSARRASSTSSCCWPITPRTVSHVRRTRSATLRELAAELGVREVQFPRTRTEWLPFDNTSLSLVRDPNKCVLCRRCVNVCAKVQSVYAIDIVGRGSNSTCFNIPG